MMEKEKMALSVSSIWDPIETAPSYKSSPHPNHLANEISDGPSPTGPFGTGGADCVRSNPTNMEGSSYKACAEYAPHP